MSLITSEYDTVLISDASWSCPLIGITLSPEGVITTFLFLIIVFSLGRALVTSKVAVSFSFGNVDPPDSEPK